MSARRDENIRQEKGEEDDDNRKPQDQIRKSVVELICACVLVYS